MAKSIRSKRKRKMRNIKREKVYGPKELAHLKKIVAIANEGQSVDEEMKELVTVTDAKTILEEKGSMEVERAPSKYNKVTKRDENGHYPVWMKSRDIKKFKKKLSGKVKRTSGGGGAKKGRSKKKGIAW